MEKKRGWQKALDLLSSFVINEASIKRQRRAKNSLSSFVISEKKQNDDNNEPSIYHRPLQLMHWCTPKLLDRLTCEAKGENNGKKKFGVHSLAHNISGVKGHVGALGCGLGWMTSGSIIHTNLYKPNNKLVSA
jgi:hypothetical protein